MKKSFVYPMTDVFAASAMAYRVNGDQYLKYPSFGSVRPNWDLMVEALTSMPENITDADRQRGDEVRRHFRRVLFTILSKDVVSSFDRSISEFLDNETTRSALEIAIIASLPKVHAADVARRSVDERINFARGGYIGAVGDRIEVEVEVLRTIYSKNWNCYFMTAITTDEQLIRWSASNSVETGLKTTIRGTVKSHTENQTKLGRVKIFTEQKETETV